MATRTLNSPGAQMSITNLSGQPLVAGPVFLQNGQTRSFPMKYLSNSWSYPSDIAALLTAGKISVAFDNPDLGYKALGITDPKYFSAVEAPSALSLGQVPVYASGSEPDANDVPEGFVVYITGGGTPGMYTAIGAAGSRAWV